MAFGGGDRTAIHVLQYHESEIFLPFSYLGKDLDVGGIFEAEVLSYGGGTGSQKRVGFQLERHE